ncbi:HAD family hydrolase [Paenibacillus cremeus]|uniref:HAD family phosphatase n=1 Tax=Paenibacillus cremeus TaxID=2163881 RepID=A0A559K5P3_9BACL|nr:HAD family hydrolase [Paenibacillus cremeus]TVY07416.1 HAD family phosphatase [Paenibacillus cremeus]
MIKLVVSDLDGTLLVGHTKSIREEDRQALLKAEELGITVAFASGRMRPEITVIAQELALPAHAISQNGAYVHLKDGTLLQSAAFERELIVRLAEAAEGTPLLTVIAGPDSYIVQQLDDRTRPLQANLMAPLEEATNMLEILGRELICGKISYIGEVPRLLELKQALEAEHGDAVDVYISDVNCLDVMPRQSSKGAGLNALRELLGVRPEESACFGDAFNDLSMFAVTPHSFAMATSHPEVQRHAARTVGSVAEALDWVFRHNEQELVKKQ